MTANEAHSHVRINSMIESAGFTRTNINVNEASVGFEGGVCNELMKRRLYDAEKIPDSIHEERVSQTVNPDGFGWEREFYQRANSKGVDS